MSKIFTYLSDLRLGKIAIIEGFTDDNLSEKLMEMGCVPGEEVMLKRIAPLGDPIIISVAGYDLSLRKEEAAGIIVKNK